MKKKNNQGFMLAETLIVTAFVAGILIFLFTQFMNLSQGYNENYKYNTSEALYSANNIKQYLLSDTIAYTYIQTNVTKDSYLNIKNCDIFEEVEYCKKLFDLEGIKDILVTTNKIDLDKLVVYDEEFKTFITKINKEGEEAYRLIISFDDSTYATIRFGETNE